MTIQIPPLATMSPAAVVDRSRRAAIGLALDATAAAERAVRAAMKAELLTALEEHRGCVTRAAAALGCHPATVHRRLEALGLAAWHRETYPRSVRQPGADERKPRRIKGKARIGKKKRCPPGQ